MGTPYYAPFISVLQFLTQMTGDMTVGYISPLNNREERRRKERSTLSIHMNQTKMKSLIFIDVTFGRFSKM
jgi:hypothetical protein